MNSGRTMFSQLMDFVPVHDLRQCVKRYNGNYEIKSFSCWDQYLCMAFAQLTYRESMRDIEVCLRAIPTRLYHMGIRGSIARSTSVSANGFPGGRLIPSYLRICMARSFSLYA